MTTQAEQAKAQMNAVFAVAECVRALGEVPSGHLYARLMGKMSLEFYTFVIETLKGAGLVEEKTHLLRWIGPKVREAGGERNLA